MNLFASSRFDRWTFLDRDKRTSIVVTALITPLPAVALTWMAHAWLGALVLVGSVLFTRARLKQEEETLFRLELTDRGTDRWEAHLAARRALRDHALLVRALPSAPPGAPRNRL